MKVNNPIIKGEKALAIKKVFEAINKEINELIKTKDNIHSQLDKEILKKLLENTKSKYHK